MQRGFGMGKQLLILNAWLCWGEFSITVSRSCFMFASLVLNSSVTLLIKADIDQTKVGCIGWPWQQPWHWQYLLYSCIHVLIRTCVLVLTQVFMMRPHNRSMRCHHPFYPFIVWNMLLFLKIPNDFQSRSTLAVFELWTHLLLRWKALKACHGKDFTVCVIISFLPLTLWPFHLVLSMFSFSLVQTVSLSIYLHWLLAHQAWCVSILWTLIGRRYGWWLIAVVSRLLEKANV